MSDLEQKIDENESDEWLDNNPEDKEDINQNGGGNNVVEAGDSGVGDIENIVNNNTVEQKEDENSGTDAHKKRYVPHSNSRSEGRGLYRRRYSMEQRRRDKKMLKDAHRFRDPKDEIDHDLHSSRYEEDKKKRVDMGDPNYDPTKHHYSDKNGKYVDEQGNALPEGWAINPDSGRAGRVDRPGSDTSSYNPLEHNYQQSDKGFVDENGNRLPEGWSIDPGNGRAYKSYDR